MAQRDDILLGPASPAADADRPLRAKLAAFVPITIAILGIGAILLGGISARQDVTAGIGEIDPVATGSIAKD
jgi:hypothetical protein